MEGRTLKGTYTEIILFIRRAAVMHVSRFNELMLIQI